VWRRLPAEERKRGKCEFVEVVKSYEQDMLVISYSLVGIRGDCDFMLWRIGYDPLKLQEMSAQLLATGLGNYLTTPYSYLSMTKRSVYVDKHTHEGQEGTRLRLVPGQFKYLFVYPFVKSKAWYRLTKHARQGMMDEHIEIGHRYPTVRLNTTYSFGLDDQEFVVAFESDKPEHFVDLVMELRHSEATSYTLRDTPTFTCIHRELPEVLDLLGG
jgi:chlorite dismutase